MHEFRWIDWNVDHIARHGISPAEAEHVINRARRPWPKRTRDGAWLVHGATASGRLLQVVYLLDPEDAVFVIHARPLTEAEKRRRRRRTR